MNHPATLTLSDGFTFSIESLPGPSLCSLFDSFIWGIVDPKKHAAGTNGRN